MNTFTVATWNLENLFRNGHQFGPRTAEEYAAKLNSLAQTILSLNPDVLAVQEVGGPEPFSDLLALLEEHYPHCLLSTHPDPRGIRVGFISRLAIESSEEITVFPQNGLMKIASTDGQGRTQEISSFGRGALGICVRPLPDRPINLLNAHLKSKLLTFQSASGQPRFTPKDENERVQAAGLALVRRTAEAVALRAKANRLIESNNRNALVVLGDLNDEANAATTQILQGPGGSEIRTRAFDRPDKGDDARLFNLAPLIPEERRYSRIYQGNKELIDHIFASQELFPGQPRRKPRVDSGVILNPMPSITDNPVERRGQPGSDHAPVFAVFEL
ncbi:MAG: endonuclease/exonuclease/phosphatase family protein [Methylococcales bacterium]|nr:endonuclease/exonuclease/phosphatase family protein [Methylococcales bacterium]